MDQLSLSPNLAIKNQSIGVANSTYDFDTSGAVPVDGILGIGPVDLTRGSLSNKTETIPTVVDNLYSQGLIAENLISISFRPSANGSTSDKNGELSFGSVDGSKHVGSLTYVPITKQQPAGVHWGIDQSVRYDNKSILNSTGGVIDSGSTLIYLASDAYDAYKVATGATLDSTTGLLRIEPSAYDKLKNLDFVIGGETFTLVPNAQIWPRALNTYIGGSNDWVYLVVNDLGEPSGNGLDFINGYAWMERFYTVYDGGANRMGFAKTSWTNATTN
ncbi:acid protease [Punctularia strigosozonata HHB-11173 SS5]|uniref:Acid protease n=1 Tax=Punctularia strigosozonata (strain HHB-11173) TaxID=741275 RepID=R7S0P9_PUNST|nr:acid protease [Punctularia strigosozonata HHB-11173 SS5]EIN03783.1 acid protease [Punctularia strigosozonata HHB-11173 SS5]